jgi:hypothetical protein
VTEPQAKRATDATQHQKVQQTRKDPPSSLQRKCSFADTLALDLWCPDSESKLLPFPVCGAPLSGQPQEMSPHCQVLCAAGFPFSLTPLPGMLHQEWPGSATPYPAGQGTPELDSLMSQPPEAWLTVFCPSWALGHQPSTPYLAHTPTSVRPALGQ